ncbi:ABC transporter substrate-binding protein [Nocardiopsis exhalans]|uniref:Iron complex transport system substrate-binding protein n=2 Tax=Nocardiopsis TaxID=2013 RepID=A0A840WB94_9ACTN|nr:MULTISPECIES: ABC transporter substrate-binding protein [Nocardiopsis]MBB5494310.1 iron complex transport system substrate-binding protein [Nocardiopsis metallicus]USY20631.1 ABC transporter substrate-binding protein [Nocardiopsis exhalans]
MKSPGRPVTALSLILASSLVLAGCSTDAQDSDGSAAADGTTVEVEDNNGTQTVASPPASVVALDNRTFETLSDWDIELSAAAVSLMPDTIGYTQDDSIIDIGTHNEPDLESIVAAEPDLVVNGQRFTQHQDDIASLVPDAAILELEPREGEPFDAELKRQITVLGEVFDKQDEAAELVAEFDAAVERVNDAYDEDASVMAVTTSGGEIGYLAPGVGRTLGPAFDIFGLTPALEVDGASDDHQGDDISVEAIADSNPDWILVMDRDAAVAVDEAGYEEADKILSESEALAGVSAVENEQIVYMPIDTYTNEGIQTYTEFFNAFADALEAQA